MSGGPTDPFGLGSVFSLETVEQVFGGHGPGSPARYPRCLRTVTISWPSGIYRDVVLFFVLFLRLLFRPLRTPRPQLAHGIRHAPSFLAS